MDRDVTWDGAYNVRDLGGLPRPDGTFTAFGRVYRSGRTEYLTDYGWRAARTSGLATIVDLRNDGEVGRRRHDPEVSDKHHAGLARVSCPVEDPHDPDFQRICGPFLDHPRSYADALAMFPDKFGRVFAALASAPLPVLVHCSGGRDRTGLIVAMLLALNGVGADAIAEDYEIAVRAANEHLLRNPSHFHEPARTGDDLEIAVRDRRKALIGWITSFDAAHFLRDRAALTLIDLGAVSTMLLPN